MSQLLNYKKYSSRYSNLSLDSYWKSINGILYLPWIGIKTKLQNDKLLIVGESVYNWAKDSKERELIKKQLMSPYYIRSLILNQGILSFSYKHKLVRNVEKALADKSLTDKNRVAFWESIYFHEFVHRPLESRAPHHRPTNKDYNNGAKVLLLVLEKLKPKSVIFLGTEERKFQAIVNVISPKYSIESQRFAKISNSIPKILFIQELNIKIYFIRHASERFSHSKWKEFIDKN